MELKKILEAVSEVKETQHGDFENLILVKDFGNHMPLKVGELFGCEVWAHPRLPGDVTFLVMSKRDLERNEA